MKFTKVKEGLYRAENGMRIVKKEAVNIWTGRPMGSRETRWHIFDETGKKVEVTITLKEAKRFVETGSIFG